MIRYTALIVMAALWAGPALSQGIDEPAAASPWMNDHNVRLRLVAGGWPGKGSTTTYAAGVELVLADGWKTYWRMPGASGVPPSFSWTGSTNVAKADVTLPAPRRFADRDGDTVGYKGAVAFPVRVTPVDPAKPVSLQLTLELGVCKDICIPVQQTLTLVIPPEARDASPGEAVKQALDKVPRKADERRPGDPEIKSRKAELTGDKPRLVVEAIYPAGASGADLFVEAPESAYVPLPKVTPVGGGSLVTFEFDLTQASDIADLKGRELKLTFVGASGQSETTWELK
jgi:DsbC/DsbD-like thiol-disulfide interchange protein